MFSTTGGRSKRPRSGSRSTRRRSGSGGTGSWPKALPGCSIGRRGRSVHRTGLAESCVAGWCICAGSVAGELTASRMKSGSSSSTVQAILRAAGCGRLDRGDRADREPVRRYERDRPGELIHVDVKKIAAIPAGGGWQTPRTRQRRAPTVTAVPATDTSTPRSMTAAGSSTPRSSTMNKPSPPPASGPELSHGSRARVSPVNASSPTTAPVTGHGSGTPRAQQRTRQ